ncbi:MAG: hypothetical protein QMD80_04360 [archaeon]|nr:hypothetical protein [archaeon]
MDKKLGIGTVVVAIVTMAIFAGCIEKEAPLPTPTPTLTPKLTATPTPTPDVHQGCYHGETVDGKEIWICNNYQATKAYIENSLRKGIPKDHGIGTIGIAHTTGNYVLIYMLADPEATNSVLPEECVHKAFFEIYDPSRNSAEDLGLLEHLEIEGITVTYYELIWQA